VVPEVGGDTLFASMYAAYEALSDSMQRFLCGLTAIHDGARNYAGRQPSEARTGAFPRAQHPVVRTHPETGRQALFVNRLFTTCLVQLKQSERSHSADAFPAHREPPIPMPCPVATRFGGVLG
jgi:taurine dioxygenase